MRDILFRGKRKDNREWVYGYVYRIWERVYILWGMTNDVPNMIEVDPETVGQFTGLYDSTKWEDLTEKERAEFTRAGNFPSECKGKKIFEGDVVKAGKVVRSIRFRNGAFEITGKTSGISMYQMAGTDLEYKVIGNIHDNPELLQMEG